MTDIEQEARRQMPEIQQLSEDILRICDGYPKRLASFALLNAAAIVCANMGTLAQSEAANMLNQLINIQKLGVKNGTKN